MAVEGLIESDVERRTNVTSLIVYTQSKKMNQKRGISFEPMLSTM